MTHKYNTMSYYRHIFHIVTRTKGSVKSIPENQDVKRRFFTYILSICNDQGWKLHRINSYWDHLHILIELPGSTLPQDAMEKIKSNSSRVFKHDAEMPLFDGWARGFASFSVSYYEIEHISNYIASQARHHGNKTLNDELGEMFRENGYDNEAVSYFISD